MISQLHHFMSNDWLLQSLCTPARGYCLEEPLVANIYIFGVPGDILSLIMQVICIIGGLDRHFQKTSRQTFAKQKQIY